MSDKPTCFVAYCHEDNTREDIDFFINQLKRKTKKKCNILYDQDIDIGKRFKYFMDALDGVDLVIMVCTPKYKEKAEVPSGGVGYEYQKISERYDAVLEEKKNLPNEFLTGMKTNFFDVLPVILKDGFNSIPAKFSGGRAVDMSYFRTIEKKISGKPYLYVPNNIKNKFDADIEKIISNINTYSDLKQESYEETVEEVYDLLKIETLFKNTKADFDNPKYDLSNYEDILFVRTNVYKEVASQSAYFLVGRKGSGKSAITQVLPKREKTKYEVININANRDTNLHIVYAFLNPKIISDTTNVFRRIECFKYAWGLFFRVCIMDLIVGLFYQDKLTDFQINNSKEIRKFIENINEGVKTEYPKEEKRNYFAFSFNRIGEFIDYCIDSARPDLFEADIENKFNMQQYFEFSLGDKVLRELNIILENFRKGFLITFDGFDTEIEKFRDEKFYFEDDSLEAKVSFEIEWLHSLLLLINNIKQMERDLLSEKVGFCLMIPNHRFLEILREDIDRYRFLHKRKFLIWTGVELVLFLRKRLEIGFYDEEERKKNRSRIENKHPIETLREIMTSTITFLPETIEFEFNGKTLKMPLFLYVLRHTLWRPRDILIYYAHLLSIGLESLENKHEVTSETVRISVANSTEYVIRDDFIGEFKGTLRNFEEILNSFHRSKQKLSFEEIEEKIGTQDFNFVAAPNEAFHKDILQKVKFLYQIGFLGISVNDKLKERYDSFSNHVFIFNEGAKILSKATHETINEYEFIIHPLFCEFLELETKHNEFISEYTWSYIKDLEGYMTSSNADFELL
ncbi:MAG: hypothetical protein M3367_11900 [Acidobacteriota bacterium]|nr:hypothetical protein [Acidobacteriota bacterium]